MTTTETSATLAGDKDLQALEKLKTASAAIRRELGKVIVGQEDVVEEALIAIFTRSHALLVGVPGLAKTLLVSTLAQTLHLGFKRIQFTPDLMPSDITGTEVIQQDQTSGERVFRFLKGPIFSNIILADEINRTPPKTQAAMLEAMQERKVTVAGVDHALPNPFFVLATQNPIEQEGTYPLPEAQLDRFMFMINVDYPTTAEELQIMKMATGAPIEKPQAVLTEEDILELQATVLRMPVAEHVYQYAERIVRVTRIKTPEANDYCKKFLSWGAGPRASLNLILAAKARAMLRGQFHVSCDDVAAVAPPILRHRIIPNFAAQSEGITADDVVKKILEAIPKDQKVA
ncbi:MAG: MoxR-like ATPase [Limisphaerales bacterium]|nr:MAG: MoxR-like ATPase [Limisphaerales bacterium]KAG0509791.1 MAG: MoxR-like ATPase [Limisphaerales bacterium]TXT50987.1 MAG: MoxR-like ATPase [Limisphaerales bacterium]